MAPKELDGDEGERAIVGFIGKGGSGKSTQLREYAARCRRLLVIDLEHRWRLQEGDELVEGYAGLFGILKEREARDPAMPFRLVYRDRTKAVMLDAGLEAAFAVEHCTVGLDEVAWVCKPNWLPEQLDRFMQMGRRYWLNLLWTSRRPQEVHGYLFDEATALFFFQLERGLGLDRVTKYYPEIGPSLLGLPPHHSRTYGNLDSLKAFGAEGT